MKETHHEKIMISTENQVAFSTAKNILDSFDMLKGKYDADLYRELIKVLLPEYQSVSSLGFKTTTKTDKSTSSY
jgi:hypothetical protein